MVKTSLMEVICQMILVLKEAMVERSIPGDTLSMDMATVATEKGDTGIMASTEDMDMAGTDLVDTVADMAMVTVDTVADMAMVTVDMVADMAMVTVDTVADMVTVDMVADMAMVTVDMVADMAMATVDMVAVDLVIAMVVMVATESTEAMGMDTEGMAMEVMDTMAKAFITIRAPTP